MSAAVILALSAVGLLIIKTHPAVTIHSNIQIQGLQKCVYGGNGESSWGCLHCDGHCFTVEAFPNLLSWPERYVLLCFPPIFRTSKGLWRTWMTAISSVGLWMISHPLWTSILGVLDGPVVGVGEGEHEVVWLVAQREPSPCWIG